MVTLKAIDLRTRGDRKTDDILIDLAMNATIMVYSFIPPQGW